MEQLLLCFYILSLFKSFSKMIFPFLYLIVYQHFDKKNKWNFQAVGWSWTITRFEFFFHPLLILIERHSYSCNIWTFISCYKKVLIIHSFLKKIWNMVYLLGGLKFALNKILNFIFFPDFQFNDLLTILSFGEILVIFRFW